MKDFEYFLPGSLEEALALLSGRRDAKILAGGTDLVVQMKDRRACPAVLIDVKKVPELNRLASVEDGSLFIGAAVPLNRVIAYPPVWERFHVLFEACSLVGSLQLRNRGTVGGNICNAAPSADTAPPLLCLSARAVVARLGGTRVVPVADFFVGPGKTVLDESELLVGIEVPRPPTPSAGSYLRHIPRQEMDIAVAGVASFLSFGQGDTCREARIALGAVAPTPVRAPGVESLLEGRPLTEESIEEAAKEASREASPISDIRGSAAYRREIVGVLTKRALETAWERYRARKRERGSIG
jgi:carbon-monoxide dehydrogenase medium subunit